MSQLTKVYVYGLADDSDCIHYIGVTASLHGRLTRHIRDGRVMRTAKARWIASLPHKPKVVILQELPNRDEGNDAERWWIAHGRSQGWPLTNVGEGGEGGPTRTGRRNSADMNAAISKAKTGVKRDPETVRRIIATKKARGLKSSEKQRRVASETFKGVPKSAEHRRRISEAHMGKSKENSHNHVPVPCTVCGRVIGNAGARGVHMKRHERTK